MRVAEKPLFLKWVLLNVVFAVFLIILGSLYWSKVAGPARFTIPLIILVGAYGSSYGARLCWRADDLSRYESSSAQRIIHEAVYLDHWAWVCPMLGILSSIAGMAVLLSNNEASTLADRVTAGGGAIFYATFVGVLMMLLLKHEQRMIEHELDGG